MPKPPAFFASATGAALLVFLFSASSSGGDGDAAKDEMKKFEGVWYSYAIEVNGKQQTVENKDDLHFMWGNKWIQLFKGRVVAEGTFTVFERKPYWVIDSEYTAPENQKGKHWHAIYRFDGDTIQWLGENRDARASIQ
jgi:uncharacterized protein (TIGR03067 family)